MCRNIKPLFNFEPHATEPEIEAAALQFVRKVSGFTEPSEANRASFDQAVHEVSHVVEHLLAQLVTTAEPKDRAIEAAKAHARAVKRFG